MVRGEEICATTWPDASASTTTRSNRFSLTSQHTFPTARTSLTPGAASATKSNVDGINTTERLLREVESGLIFTNLVDFDMLYGHRNDVEGYARALEEAGADMLLLECVPMDLAARITANAKVPVIGIGAGPDVDGQILVLYDILDIAPGKRTRISRNYMEGSRSIHHAIGRYVEEVRGRVFPTAEYAFT